MQPVRLLGFGAMVPQAGTHRNPRTRASATLVRERAGQAGDPKLDGAPSNDSAAAKLKKRALAQVLGAPTFCSNMPVALTSGAAQKLDRAPRTPYTPDNG
jgi:hypothetical protein